MNEKNQERIQSNLARMLRGETTLAELKGIGDEEMRAGLRAGRHLMEAGEEEAAAEVLGGLALYDPYRAETWQCLAELSQRMRQPDSARLYQSLARAMAA